MPLASSGLISCVSSCHLLCAPSGRTAGQSQAGSHPIFDVHPVILVKSRQLVVDLDSQLVIQASD